MKKYVYIYIKKMCKSILFFFQREMLTKSDISDSVKNKNRTANWHFEKRLNTLQINTIRCKKCTTIVFG